MNSDDLELRRAAALLADKIMAEQMQAPDEFPIPDTRSAQMAANFLYVLVARQGGSITIPAKIWNAIVHPDVQVKLTATKNGDVKATINRQAERLAGTRKGGGKKWSW